jgi:UDP-N-acetylmuramoylalanine--D-glutamate ligase
VTTVIGLAATGVAVARVLARRGERVTVLDSKDRAALNPATLSELEALGISVLTGESLLPAETTLVIPSPGVPESASPLVQARERRLTVWSEIELGYRIARAPIAAITGTNGKTTTTAMLGAICRAAGRETFVCGNIAEDNGVRIPLIEAAAQASETAVLVAEISSFQLAQTESFRPKAAAWLNLTPDHLDRYASLDAYAQDKAKILQNQTDTDFAVLNASDPIVVRLSEGVGRGQRVWLDGASPPERVLKVPGKHNLANAEAAALLARALGIDDAVIEAALSDFAGVAHRMEQIGSVSGVEFVNNSMCTNPAAVSASLDACTGEVIAICGGKHKGGDLTEMAEALARRARFVLLIGEAAEALAEALRAQSFTAFKIVKTLECAVSEAIAWASPGETVILVPGCASFDQFSSFEARGQCFRELIREAGSKL